MFSTYCDFWLYALRRFTPSVFVTQTYPVSCSRRNCMWHFLLQLPVWRGSVSQFSLRIHLDQLPQPPQYGSLLIWREGQEEKLILKVRDLNKNLNSKYNVFTCSSEPLPSNMLKCHSEPLSNCSTWQWWINHNNKQSTLGMEAVLLWYKEWNALRTSWQLTQCLKLFLQ